jgi:hypothetical protein
MKSRFAKSWQIWVAAVAFWIATIYTAPSVHNFFDNGFGYDAYTQWPPRDLFEGFRVLLLGIGWLLYTAFVAFVVTLIGMAIGFIAMSVWVLVGGLIEDLRKKNRDKVSGNRTA